MQAIVDSRGEVSGPGPSGRRGGDIAVEASPFTSTVLIGGEILQPGQFLPISDTQIQVIAPMLPGTNLPVVVETTSASNDNIGIMIT